MSGGRLAGKVAIVTGAASGIGKASAARFRPGDGVGIGRDDTIYARQAGVVQFSRGRRGRVVSVVENGDGA